MLLSGRQKNFQVVVFQQNPVPDTSESTCERKLLSLKFPIELESLIFSVLKEILAPNGQVDGHMIEPFCTAALKLRADYGDWILSAIHENCVLTTGEIDEEMLGRNLRCQKSP